MRCAASAGTRSTFPWRGWPRARWRSSPSRCRRDLLADLIGATGLPSLLPAAEPPLGTTARIAIGASAPRLTFGLVFYLLRVLDRSMLGGSRPRRAGQRRGHAEASPPRRPSRRAAAPPDLGRARARRAGAAGAARRRDAALAGRGRAGEPAAAIEAAPEAPAAGADERRARARAAEPGGAGRGIDQPRRADGAARAGPRPPRRRPARTRAAAAPQVFPEAADERLQSAIDSLQRLAARQS